MSKKKSIDKDKPKGGSPKAASSPKKINKMNKPDTPFFMVSGSAIGKSHKGTGTPCQDSSFCGTLSNGWGIAIVCDGAGSAANSQQGSEWVAKNAFQIFKVALEESRFYKGNVMPNDDDIWADLAKDCIKKIQENLKKYAEAEDLAYTSLACTLIVVVYSPIGMLVAHVGDGRAGYKNEAGKWLPIMTPHKGEEANQTVFITSSFFENRLLLSGLEVPEMRVIREIPYAFTLMSDGCEKASFLCSVFNKDEQKWTDPNLPFPGFFDPLIDQLRTIAPKHEKLETKLRAIEDNSQNKANSIWQQFLEGGMPQLAEESDDKTMIVGILL